jgi:biotin operon repressor
MRRRTRGSRGRNEEGQYFIMPYVMVHSSAWRSPSGAAIKVWHELRTRFRGGNNGKLVLSYEEAATLLSLSKSTVKRALEELQEKGFIVCTRPGQWYGRLASEWAVTDKGVEGNPPTRAWRQWMPPIGTNTARKNRSRYRNGTVSPNEGAARVPKEV